MSIKKTEALTNAIGELIGRVNMSNLAEPATGFNMLPRGSSSTIESLARSGIGRVWWVEYLGATLNQDAGTSTEFVVACELAVGYKAGAGYSQTTAQELILNDSIALIQAIDWPVDSWPGPILTLVSGQPRVEEGLGEGNNGQVISAQILRIPLQIEYTTA